MIPWLRTNLIVTKYLLVSITKHYHTEILRPFNVLSLQFFWFCFLVGRYFLPLSGHRYYVYSFRIHTPYRCQMPRSVFPAPPARLLGPYYTFPSVFHSIYFQACLPVCSGDASPVFPTGTPFALLALNSSALGGATQASTNHCAEGPQSQWLAQGVDTWPRLVQS